MNDVLPAGVMPGLVLAGLVFLAFPALGDAQSLTFTTRVGAGKVDASDTVRALTDREWALYTPRSMFASTTKPTDRKRVPTKGTWVGGVCVLDA